MKLEKIKIKNFGLFAQEKEIPIKGSIASIIGDNGTGKSSIIFAIKLLLDRATRREGVSVEWIPNTNLKTSFEYIFNSEGFKKINVALPIEENLKITIRMELDLDEELNRFHPTIYIGDIEKLKYSFSQKLPFDDFIEVIHISPNLESNNNKWIETYFKESNVLSEIEGNIDILNTSVSNIQPVSKFNAELKRKLDVIMKGSPFSMSLEANIKSTKLGAALNIFPMNNASKRIITHGHGLEKIMSILSGFYKSEEDKIKIILIDELENHFFYTYQSKVIDFLETLLKENVAQILITTHSPNAIKISPGSSITKLMHDSNPKFIHLSEDSQFDYYQKDLPTAVFYEKILLVEGHSEKMFFEYLFKYNQPLKKEVDTSEIHILNNHGRWFLKTATLLNKMANNIVILTDNDVWDKNGQKECFGLKRVWDLSCNFNFGLDKDKYKDFSRSHIESNDIKKEILSIGSENNIFSQSELGKTFEDSLLDEGLVDEKEMKELKKAKLKNLSSFITEISKRITKQKIEESKYLFKWVKVI